MANILPAFPPRKMDNFPLHYFIKEPGDSLKISLAHSWEEAQKSNHIFLSVSSPISQSRKSRECGCCLYFHLLRNKQKRFFTFSWNIRNLLQKELIFVKIIPDFNLISSWLLCYLSLVCFYENHLTSLKFQLSWVFNFKMLACWLSPFCTLLLDDQS
jgi:hypothetical protein